MAPVGAGSSSSFREIGTLDKAIAPYAQLFMAQRAKAQTSIVEVSHLSIISHPDAAGNFILQALELAQYRAVNNE